MRRSDWDLRPFFVGSALLVVLALGAVPAAAKIVHPFTASFSGSGSPAGSVTPVGVAVDPSGDVYVSDSAHKVLDKFSSAGAYLCQVTGAGESSTSPSECDKTAPGPGLFASALGDGIVEAGGDLLFPDYAGHVINRFSAAGAYAPPQLSVPGSGTPLQVALDASGEVYVVDLAHRVVDRYEPSSSSWSTFATGTPAGVFTAPSPAGVAVDDDPSSPTFGDVYIADPQSHAVDVFQPDGAYSFRITATPQGALSASLGRLATDPSDGHLFVADTGGRAIDEFAPGGVFVSQTTVPSTPNVSSPLAVALDTASGTLYVADKANGLVDVFSTFVVPDDETMPATQVEEAAATLNGHLDPEGGGEVTQCRFEYVDAAHYQPNAVNPYAAGHTQPCSPQPPYAGPQAVSAGIGGLLADTTYHYRVVAANSNAYPSPGEDETLITQGPPTVDEETATVSGVNAEVKAQIDPFGFSATCQVQYVDEADFKRSGYGEASTLPCPGENIGSGFGDVQVRVHVQGLKVGTTYHYRFLATNSAGKIEGEDRTFVTFGMHAIEYGILDSEGHPYTQAAGHPYELITDFTVNWSENVGGAPHDGNRPLEILTGNLKDVITQLPAGLLGNPGAAARCTRADMREAKCPGAAQIGLAQVNVTAENGRAFMSKEDVGIYNLVPPKGVAAEFGFFIYETVEVFIDARLRSDGDYGVTAEAANASTLAGVSEVFVHFWGVPGDPRHDVWRYCPNVGRGLRRGCSTGVAPKPFLRDPTSCSSGPLFTTLAFDSWQTPGQFDEHVIETPAVEGCETVPFDPSLPEASLTTSAADSPSGLSFDLHLPQPEGCKEENGQLACENSESDLRDTTITFPVGVTVNPSLADGLAACSEAQIGFTGFKELNPSSEPGVKTAQFTGLPAQCPDASKLGTVEVDTPLVDHPLTGGIYLAKQGENPFGSLLAVYIAIYDPVTGVVVKLPGEVKADPSTGQLSTTVLDSPQVPFEDFKIKLFEDPRRAALTTPATCGSYATTSVMKPWSGTAAVTPSSPPFDITTGAAGGTCPQSAAQEPFAPSFSAGTYSPIAGSYSPLVLKVGREDGSQQLQSLNVTLPEGLLGKLAGIEQCSQSAIEAAQRRSGLGEGRVELERPSCPLGSDIGSVHVGVGSAAQFYVTGHAYLAGPYEGAPYSVVVITPAVAGPFDLGTVVVRSGLVIDPHTVQVTVKSDPFPTMLYGIPVDIRSIAVLADRQQFTLNPTSCAKTAVNGTITSTQGAQANVTSPFQVGGCNNLAFKPSFAASTNGSTSRKNGASLNVKVVANPGDANIAKVDVQLPKQLPSRLETIKLACTEAQFASDPAACPAGSRVATATVHTPLLASPLTGPVYFVSHGGAAFPDLVMVLQSEGVTIVLVGQTEIKGAITYSRFEAVPDAPFSTFELVSPQGPHSILGANLPASAKSSFCAQALTMPTTLTAQNGLVLKQNTRIAVTGCKATRRLTRAQLLAKALKACRHRYKGAGHARGRKACEQAARKRYAAKSKHKKK